jgi:hypothetical protein
VSRMDQDLRDLLEDAIGEPPRRVSAAVVRRRAVRRRAWQLSAVSAAAVLVAGLGSAVSGGAIRLGTSPASAPVSHAGPPRYYVARYSQGSNIVLAVRATATGRVTALLPQQRGCADATGDFTPADHQTFFLICTSEGAPWDSRIYRFRVTDSGRIAGYSQIRGGDLKGVLAENIAATQDGSQVAVEVLRPDPSGQIYTDTVPAGIIVINTRTGARAMWRTGPYKRGAVQFAGALSMSFTGDGRQLVVFEALCRRGRSKTNCTGHDPQQVRAFAPAAAGGSLEAGRVLLRQSSLRPPGTVLVQAYISPDGSAVTAVTLHCPHRGACTLSVARISVRTATVLSLLYQVQSGTAFQGVFERFFSTDPSGRYLILDAGAGKKRVSGWIRNGRLVPLAPAEGAAVDYEAW